MCENQKIPEKGDTVKIIPMDGHVFNDKTGVILSTDLVTYVAEIKMDNPFPKEKAEIQVHMSKLELLEWITGEFFFNKKSPCAFHRDMGTDSILCSFSGVFSQESNLSLRSFLFTNRFLF